MQTDNNQTQNFILITDLIEPIKIDNIEVDVVKEHIITYDSEVTEFPVETGFIISDHVINKQPVLRLDCIFTPTPVTWFELHKDQAQTRLEDVRRELKRIRDEGEPITVSTPESIYENAVLVSVPLSRNTKDGYSLRCTLEFRLIAVVQSNTAGVPAEYAEQETKVQAQTGKTEENAGTATTKDIGDGGSGAVGEGASSGDTNSSYDTGSEETANTSRSILKSITSGW